MHADRKGIPLVSDTEFLALLEHVQPGELEETPQRPARGSSQYPRVEFAIPFLDCRGSG